ncbi:MAG: carotenoid 1,2-hydratase [Chloroflexi bacterium]|nr:carotenoid 1,2-hydratase [Chloroflexota bacterium]
MWRLFIAGVIILGVVIFGFSLIDSSAGAEIGASALIVDTGGDTSGYARAFEPLDWQFPRDFGAHPDYQTEWWYYTGNLSDESGRRFGYQFTIFRRAITPTSAEGGSEWRSNQLYMAHFAVTDVAGERFYHDERFSRGSAGLAGAESDPTYRVWLEGWQVIGTNADATQTRITAATEHVVLDLALEQVNPPALQGDRGLSAKSAEPGNASHYYSLTDLISTGTLTIDGETFTVSGTTWKDHEFSTSALGGNARGWDWFGLQFADNRELMIGQIRLTDGGRDPYFGGLLVNADGSTIYLPADAFSIEATATWTSPHTGATYPAGWRITVTPPEGEPFTFTATPQIADQELHGGGIAYWEGTVRLEGEVTGYGYAELTGYADSMTGRF